MNLTIGPTRPPSACLPNPPIPSTGVKPFSMKNAVINPQALNAAMFGMIMPDKNVPNFCTATRTLFALLTGTSAFTAILVPPCRAANTPPPTCPHRAPSRQVPCRAYRTVAQASGSAPGPIAYAAADIAIAPFLASLDMKPPRHEQRYCPGQAERPTANQLRHA